MANTVGRVLIVYRLTRHFYEQPYTLQLTHERVRACDLFRANDRFQLRNLILVLAKGSSTGDRDFTGGRSRTR